MDIVKLRFSTREDRETGRERETWSEMLFIAMRFGMLSAWELMIGIARHHDDAPHQSLQSVSKLSCVDDGIGLSSLIWPMFAMAHCTRHPSKQN